MRDALTAVGGAHAFMLSAGVACGCGRPRPVKAAVVANRRTVVQILLDPSGKHQKERALFQAYATLGLDPNNAHERTPDVVKAAYAHLCKRLHPDTGGPTADADQLQRVQRAYRTVCGERPTDERVDMEEFAQRFDIRHTAPQHRRYLEYGGAGSGTPFDRQRQHRKRRAAAAHHASSDYMFRKAYANDSVSELVMQTEKDKDYARRWKSGNAMERLVEDLIQESINNGDFDNLKGSGKPLKHDSNHNPYLDTMTNKLNQILVHNGFTPEWILMEKDIKTAIAELRSQLLQNADQPETELFAQFEGKVADMNKQINSFNLHVPILSKQMIHVDLKKEVSRAITARLTQQQNSVSCSEANKTTLSSTISPQQTKSPSSVLDYVLDTLSDMVLRRIQ